MTSSKLVEATSAPSITEFANLALFSSEAALLVAGTPIDLTPSAAQLERFVQHGSKCLRKMPGPDDPCHVVPVGPTDSVKSTVRWAEHDGARLTVGRDALVSVDGVGRAIFRRMQGDSYVAPVAVMRDQAAGHFELDLPPTGRAVLG